MVSALISLIIFIWGLAAFAAGFVNLSLMHPGKAFIPGSLLHALYIPYIEKAREPYSLLLTLLRLGACLAFFCRFANTSNHFILSLDILFFLSAMLLIFYHALKLTRIPSAS